LPGSFLRWPAVCPSMNSPAATLMWNGCWKGSLFLPARIQLEIGCRVSPVYSVHHRNSLSTLPVANALHGRCQVRFRHRPERPGEMASRFKRGTVLRSVISNDTRTACEYRPGHAVTLWPVAVVDASYYARDLLRLAPPGSVSAAKAAFASVLKLRPTWPLRILIWTS
jgi:hypothetical protein